MKLNPRRVYTVAVKLSIREYTTVVKLSIQEYTTVVKLSIKEYTTVVKLSIKEYTTDVKLSIQEYTTIEMLSIQEHGALPKILDLKVRYFQDCWLWHQRNTGVLEQLLQKSKVKIIKIDFSGGRADIGKFILRKVIQSEDPVLESLELPKLNVLHVLAPLFSGPEGYSGLKDLQAELSSEAATAAVKYPLFASIVAHQTALESLDLSQLGQFPKDTEGERFISALTSLLGQPQFKTLRLCWCEGLPLASLQAIVEAFKSSSPQSEQHLTLVSMTVVVLSRWQSLLNSKHRTKPHLTVSAEHAAAYGPRKHLCFQYSHIPCAFFKWFCSMEHIQLNTLEFLRCRSDSSKCTIREHFEQHTNFNVQYVRCS